MKILVVTQYFWPENFKINDLCIELKKRDHEVNVLTGKPNYPTGKYFKGYNFYGYSEEYYEDIRVNRVPLFSRGKGGNFNLFFNYLSYVFFSTIFLLFNKKKYDIIFCYAVSPITSAIPALIAKYLYDAKFYIWIQDLWPESTYVNGRIKNRFIKFLLEKMVTLIYKKSDKIFIQAESMRKPILEKINADKIKNCDIIFLPNWAEDFYYRTINSGLKYSKLIPDDKFVVLFAGNIGSGIDISSIIQAIDLLKSNNHIIFVFVGEGSEKRSFRNLVNTKNLGESVLFLKSYPAKEMPYFYHLADLLFTSFRDEEIYSYTLPSKIPTYMASGKPLIAMANGQTSLTIRDAKCGISVPAGDYKSLAKNIEYLSTRNKEDLSMMGENGKNYSKRVFNKSIIVDEILK